MGALNSANPDPAILRADNASEPPHPFPVRRPVPLLGTLNA
jgi:hypothetical protein